jgi:c-di-GMP-binding flagellar brake protein YcgR
MAQDDETPQVQRLPLRELGLRTGMALQTRRLVEGASKKESQFFGAIEGKGVMVGPIGSESAQTGLQEGEVCVVRGFTGIYEYSFLSKVLQTFEKPFVYALLAYPAQVDAKRVRQSMRMKSNCPVEVVHPAPAQPATLVDISLAGAMIRTVSNVATVGQEILLGFSPLIEGELMRIEASASVCHSNHSSAEGAFFTGVAFKNLSSQHKLVLHYLTTPSKE